MSCTTLRVSYWVLFCSQMYLARVSYGCSLLHSFRRNKCQTPFMVSCDGVSNALPRNKPYGTDTKFIKITSITSLNSITRLSQPPCIPLPIPQFHSKIQLERKWNGPSTRWVRLECQIILISTVWRSTLFNLYRRSPTYVLFPRRVCRNSYLLTCCRNCH